MLRLQMEREKRGWTKTELSRRAEIDLAGYSRVERGLMVPYQPWRQRLARVLGLSADQLFEEIEQQRCS